MPRRRSVAAVVTLLLGAEGFAPSAVRAPSYRRPGDRRASVLRAEATGRSGGLSKYASTVFLGLIALQAGIDLVDEVPKLAGESRDIFGTAFDAGAIAFAASRLAEQTGLTGPGGGVSDTITLDGIECDVTLNVGREQGTWMPKEWGESGARLSLPLPIIFSDEAIDLGFPGEEALGGRYARRLRCGEGRFIGARGETIVRVDGGAWTASPMSGTSGQFKLRFFLDFPEGAERNDVSIPSGRVFFSGALFDRERMMVRDADELPAELVGATIAAGDERGSLRLLKEGGLTIKKNGVANLYGALGDVSLILGKYTISEAKQRAV